MARLGRRGGPQGSARLGDGSAWVWRMMWVCVWMRLGVVVVLGSGVADGGRGIAGVDARDGAQGMVHEDVGFMARGLGEVAEWEGAAKARAAAEAEAVMGGGESAWPTGGGPAAGNSGVQGRVLEGVGARAGPEGWGEDGGAAGDGAVLLSGWVVVPPRMHWGGVGVCRTERVTFSVTHAWQGEGAVTITDVSSTAPFLFPAVAVGSPAGGDGPNALPVTLEPGEDVTFHFMFSPLRERLLHEASVIITSTKGAHVVPGIGLSGEADPHGCEPVRSLSLGCAMAFRAQVALNNPYNEPMRVLDAYTSTWGVHLAVPGQDAPDITFSDVAEERGAVAQQHEAVLEGYEMVSVNNRSFGVWNPQDLDMPSAGTPPKGEARIAGSAGSWTIEPGKRKSVLEVTVPLNEIPSSVYGFVALRTDLGGVMSIPIQLQCIPRGLRMVQMGASGAFYESSTTQGVLNFGTLTSASDAMTLPVVLINSGPDPVMILDMAIPPNPNVELSFKKGTVLPPHGVQPIAVADITVSGGMQGKMGGILFISVNDSTIAIPEIKYLVHVLHGQIAPLHPSDSLFLWDPQPIDEDGRSTSSITRSIVAVNRFDVPVEVLFTSIHTHDGLFSIAPVAPMSYSLGPMQRTHPLEVTFNPQGLTPGLAASLKDHSFLSRAEIQFVNNISKPLVLPLYAYNGVLDFTWEMRGTDPSEFHLTGNLKTREVRVLSDRILNFGTLPVGEAHTRRLHIMNRNPVFVAVEHIKLQGASSVLSFNVRNDKGEIVTSLTPGSAESQVVIAPHSSAFVEICVVAAFAGEDGGWISMEPSTMGALNFSVVYEAVEGDASVEHASFSMAFPGRIATQYLRLTNNFDIPLKVLEVQSATDPRLFSLLDPDASLVPPHTTASIGFLRFDAARKGAVGLLSYAEDGSSYMDDGNMKSMLSRVGEPLRRADLQALRRRENAWEWMSSNGLTSVGGIFSVRTNIQGEINGTIHADLVRPDLTPLYPDGEAVFPLIEVGDSSQIFIEVFNPSDAPVHFALVPLGTELSEKVPIANQRMFRLGDGGLPADVAEGSGVVTQVVLPSLERSRLGPITYIPDRVGNHSLTAYIHNNLTLLTQVKLMGRTGWGALDFGRAGADGSLELSWEEGPGLGRLVGTFEAKNRGDMKLRLVDYGINDMCSEDGLTVTISADISSDSTEPIGEEDESISSPGFTSAGRCMHADTALAPGEKLVLGIVAEDVCLLAGGREAAKGSLRLVTAVGSSKIREVTHMQLRGALPRNVSRACEIRSPRGRAEEFARILAKVLLGLSIFASVVAGPALSFVGKERDAHRMSTGIAATNIINGTNVNLSRAGDVPNTGNVVEGICVGPLDESDPRVAPIATVMPIEREGGGGGRRKRGEAGSPDSAGHAVADSPTVELGKSDNGTESPDSAGPDDAVRSRGLDRLGSGSSSSESNESASFVVSDRSPRSPIKEAKGEWPVPEEGQQGPGKSVRLPRAVGSGQRGNSIRADTATPGIPAATGQSASAGVPTPPGPHPLTASGVSTGVGPGASRAPHRSASGRVIARSIGGGGSQDASIKASMKSKATGVVTARPLKPDLPAAPRAENERDSMHAQLRSRELLATNVKADAKGVSNAALGGAEERGGLRKAADVPHSGLRGRTTGGKVDFPFSQEHRPTGATLPQSLSPSMPAARSSLAPSPAGAGGYGGRERPRLDVIQGHADYETFGSPAMRNARDGGEFNLADGYALFRELEGHPPPAPPVFSAPRGGGELSWEDPEFHCGEFLGSAQARAPVGSHPNVPLWTDFAPGRDSRALLFGRALEPTLDNMQGSRAGPSLLPSFFGPRSPERSVDAPPEQGPFAQEGSLSLDAATFAPPGAHRVGAPVAGGDGEALTPRRQNSLAFGSAFSTFNVLFDNDPAE